MPSSAIGRNVHVPPTPKTSDLKESNPFEDFPSAEEMTTLSFERSSVSGQSGSQRDSLSVHDAEAVAVVAPPTPQEPQAAAHKGLAALTSVFKRKSKTPDPGAQRRAELTKDLKELDKAHAKILVRIAKEEADTQKKIDRLPNKQYAIYRQEKIEADSARVLASMRAELQRNEEARERIELRWSRDCPSHSIPQRGQA